MEKSSKAAAGKDANEHVWATRLRRIWEEVGKPFIRYALPGVAIIVFWVILPNLVDQSVKAFIFLHTEARVQSYLGRFLVSPAMAGLAALAAAVITASVLAAQVRHTKMRDKEENWWKRYEWITERAFPSKKVDSNPVPQAFAIVVLNQLESEKKTDLQGKACGSFITEIFRVGVTIPAPEGLAVPTVDSEGVKFREAGIGLPQPLPAERLDKQVFQAALDYVDNTEGTVSSSPEAEVLVFREQIAKALDDEGIDFKLAFTPKDLIEVRSGSTRMCIVALPRDRDAAMDRIKSLKKMVVPVIVLAQKATDLKVESGSESILLHWEPNMGSRTLRDIIGAIVRKIRTM